LGAKSIGLRLLKRFLGHYEYELKDKSLPLRGPRGFCSWLTKRGLRPSTVFDVGVGYGPPWLYESFPDAYFVLVEPNIEFSPCLAEICKRYRGEHHILAAGDKVSRGTLRVNENSPTSSGFLPVSDEYLKSLESRTISRQERTREVEIRPLDDLVSERTEPPFLVKLDVEGYETEVLKGGAQILQNTDVLISEVSIMKRWHGEVRFAEFIGYLDDIGFELFDIIDLRQTTRDGPLSYIDAAFVKRDSPFEKFDTSGYIA
jgi:FkbM family methyltransferase